MNFTDMHYELHVADLACRATLLCRSARPAHPAGNPLRWPSWQSASAAPRMSIFGNRTGPAAPGPSQIILAVADIEQTGGRTRSSRHCSQRPPGHRRDLSEIRHRRHRSGWKRRRLLAIFARSGCSHLKKECVFLKKVERLLSLNLHRRYAPSRFRLRRPASAAPSRKSFLLLFLKKEVLSFIQHKSVSKAVGITSPPDACRR